jgi:regulator of protease activity HflC (stomatin/prohibitin superfamily)
MSMLVKIVLIAVATFLMAAYAPLRPLAIPFAVVALAIAFVVEGVRVVPQQNAWIVERLGKFHEVLEPGLNVIIPFIDRVAYRHSLKEVPLDVAEQVCITKDNTQLAVDGLIYYQVTDPRLASYGTSDFAMAITQLAQTTLRSEVGKMELDRTLQSREEINRSVVAVLDEAGRSWGVKVLRYEVKSLTPPESILRAMQQQITAEREKRALIAKSEGEKQQEINLAEGEKQAAILKSEGEKQSAINKAQGEATALRVVAEATAAAVNAVADAIGREGGLQAANLKIAEAYIGAFGNLAKTNNTMIVPSDLADVASVVASAMTVLDRTRSIGARPPAAPAAKA